MRYCWLFLLLLLGGCHLGPRYEAPDLSAPVEWKTAVSEADLASCENWWEIFGDEELNRLECLVVENNPDLTVALEKVAEARALAGIAKSTLYPQANLNPSYNNVNQLIELYGVPQGLFPGLQTITRVKELTYQLPVAMSYEVDLWGRFRGTYNAASIYAQARDEALKATMLTLTSDLASNYFNALAVDTQLSLIAEVLRLQKKKLKLTTSRFDAGLVSLMELLEVEGHVADLDAEYQETARQRAQFENAMAALIGTPASEFQVASRLLLLDPPAIPAGLPSSMLVRRPDVAQAERMMASLHEFIGVAYSSYLPGISLTSAIGYLSPDLSQFLRWPSRLWQFGVNISETIFNAGRNSSYVKLAYARFRETKAAYESAVLTAFQEVEDALTNVGQQNKQFDSLEESWKAAEKNNWLSQKRYGKGIVSLLDTLDAEEKEIDAKRSYLNVLGNRYQSTVQLIKALGGGWGDLCKTSAEESGGCGEIKNSDEKE